MCLTWLWETRHWGSCRLGDIGPYRHVLNVNFSKWTATDNPLPRERKSSGFGKFPFPISFAEQRLLCGAQPKPPFAFGAGGTPTHVTDGES
jgi:hypothetical protein